jgi:ABC-type multidrug transport system fused ATPase/permease subunit
VADLPVNGRLRLFATAALHAVERIGIVGVAVAFAHGAKAATWIAAALLAVLFWAQTFLRSALERESRAALADAGVSSLLRGDLLQAAPDEDLHATVFEGIHYGAQLLSAQLPALLGNAAALLPVCAVLAIEASPGLLAVTAALLAAALAAALTARGITARHAAAMQVAWQQVLEDVGATIDGRLDIVASGLGDDFRRQLRDHLAHWTSTARRGTWTIAIVGRAPAIAAAGIVAFALAVDSHLRQALSTTVFTTVAVAAAAIPTFFGLLRDAIELTRTGVRLRAFLALLEAAPAPRGGARGAPLPDLPAPLEWRDVAFAYREATREREHLAVRDVSIEWRPGRVLALQGPNGSGKSTLLRLLLGMGRPAAGSILVAGRDLFDLDLAAWRRAIAYLPQRPYLNERVSVRQAMRFLAPEASDVRMTDALESVELWSVLSAHAHRGDPLSARVGSLSAGERQRLALARLLCQNAAIVLLDEPDANLDARGLAIIERLVKELSRDRMVAIAAHAPELLRLGDTLVVLRSETDARGAA